jgi:hypothetical protein
MYLINSSKRVDHFINERSICQVVSLALFSANDNAMNTCPAPFTPHFSPDILSPRTIHF